jgi:regulator of protease activity HflC (stomatin/prohibitin superfamily)
MTLNDDAWILLGILSAIAVPLFIFILWKNLTKAVYPGETILVLRFGKMVRRLDEPGLHFIWDKAAPWTQLVRVSRRLDYELLDDLEIHDAAGTSVKVDVFVEYRVVDPIKASFNVEDLPQALANVASHSVIAALGGRQLNDIIRDSGRLSHEVREELKDEADVWGVVIEKILLRNVRPSGVAMEQLLTEIAARLEKAKARVEEEGRQEVALIEARTTEQVAERAANAKGRYLLEIGKAYEELRQNPEAYAAYRQLHELVLLRPAHTVAFRGFNGDSLRPTEAMFFEQPGTVSAPSVQ